METSIENRVLAIARKLSPEGQQALYNLGLLLEKYGSFEEVANHLDELPPEERGRFLDYLDYRNIPRPQQQDHLAS